MDQRHDLDSGTAERPSWRRPLRTAASIYLGYSLVSGFALSFFFVYVDVTTAMEGSINGDFCSTMGPSGFGVTVFPEGVTCVIHFDYVLFEILYFPVCIIFWQTLFGAIVVATIGIVRKCRRSARGAEQSVPSRIEGMFPPITIASTLHIFGVFTNTAINVVTRMTPMDEPSWRGLLKMWPVYLPPVDMFAALPWLFLLPPVPIFVAAVYLRKWLHQRSLRYKKNRTW
jgi:hypothetical protein